MTSVIENVAGSTQKRLSAMTDKLVNIGEAMTTKEFSKEEGFKWIFWTVTAILGLTAVIGASEIRIDTLEGFIQNLPQNLTETTVIAGTGISSAIASRLDRGSHSQLINSQVDNRLPTQ
jgi:hypothetical protein